MSDHPARAFVLLAVLLFAGAVSPLAAGDDVDLDAFVRELEAIGSKTASATPEEAASLRAQLPANWRVRVGPRTIDVSSRWIVAALQDAQRDPASWPSKRQRLTTRIAAVTAEAVALRDAPDVAADSRASAVLADVLARKEFQRSATSLWMERLRNRIGRWLVDLFERIGGRGPSRRTLAVAFAWIVGIGALAVLSFWLVRLIVGAAGAHALDIAHARSKERTSGGWARLALAAHEAGDAREATRLGYHAAVRRIEEEGTWKTDEARTPREYLRLLPHAHRRRALFAEVTGLFERIWYGAASATPDDSRRVLASLKDLGCLASDQVI